MVISMGDWVQNASEGSDADQPRILISRLEDMPDKLENIKSVFSALVAIEGVGQAHERILEH